ncbi:MAG: hypothetical protein Q9219_005936 [cf. Caloplaca sp. 3 TL-2023]
MQQTKCEVHEEIRPAEAPESVWKLPAPTVSEPERTIFKPQLLQGQEGTQLADNLWSRVAEEIHDSGDVSEDSVNEANDDGISDDDFAHVLGSEDPLAVLPHPPADVIFDLWQIFVENINPLSKLVHVPSLQHAIEKAATDIHRVPKGFEALMFAMYSMAVKSLTNDDCNAVLGESQDMLFRRYLDATKKALSRAKFMSSTSIVVLQALVLHILAIRDQEEPRAVWTLTGAAIRVAEGMGLGIDGSLLGLSPFETEIRRRIWWQLRIHDLRAAELSGQAKFRDFELDDSTPKQPANVNDNDLYPLMPRAPAESTKLTEMCWCVFRSDLVTFASTQKIQMKRQRETVLTSGEDPATDDLQTKDSFIKQAEDMIETKYLRYCDDPSQPLHLLMLLGARLETNLMRFMAHHPRRWATVDMVPEAERQMVWNTVMQLLSQYDMLQTNPQLRCFAWNVPYFIQWQAVIHVLDTLRAEPLHPEAAKAWRLIDAMYDNNSELLLASRRPIFVAVGNLCLKAFDARVGALAREVSEPTYIALLREQREAAKIRRQVKLAGRNAQEGSNRGSGSTAAGTRPEYPDAIHGLVEGLPEAPPPQQASAAADPLSQTGTWTGDDAFWLEDSINNDFARSGVNGLMGFDVDCIMAQDTWPGNSDGEEIDWAQWDSWLGDFNPTRF